MTDPRRAPKIGDHVKIHVSGECTFHHLGTGHLTPDSTLQDLFRALGGPGYQGANDGVGVVVSITPEAGSHPYYVSDAEGGRWNRVDDFFAETELEPVDP